MKKAEKLIEARIQDAVNGIEMNIMDMSKVSKLARNLIAINPNITREDLNHQIQAFVSNGCK